MMPIKSFVNGLLDLNSTETKLFKRIITIVCCSLLLSGCGVAETNPNLISARVERVVSGQTLEIDAIAADNTYKTTRVRIIGIDAPDLRQYPWGTAAKQRLAELVGRDSIQLETETQTADSFDRLLAHVWHNKTLISEQLIEEGYVLADTKYPHKYSQRLLNAREYARLLGYGIWNPKQPLRRTPSQFRARSSSS
ncbi:thermonuclease family protein [Myxosarcina sp. GI1(2024)]